jgi:hypothetical protein
MDGSIFYIELFSLHTSDLFLLYIPSKYTFELDKGDDVFKLSYLEISTSEDIADDYTEKSNMLSNYNKINLGADQGKVEEYLIDQYKQPIVIKDVSEEDSISIKSIYRQLQRLRYCVQNLKYKLGIIYKNYLCTIRRDDTLSCFNIKHFPRNESKRLLVIVDLETLYEKSDSLIEDVKTVKESIYKVLEKNQSMHSNILSKMAENRRDIITIPQQAEIKKIEYDILFADYKKILETVNNSEKKIIEEIEKLEIEANQGLHNDINKAHNRAKLDKDLDILREHKNEIARNMVQIRNKRENSVLNIDDIMFNNTIMFDAMLKNFAKLKEYT